jgi:predicted nucleic acid-binding protein
LERGSQTIVVDASVVIKWFIPEADSDKAVKLRDRHVEGSLTLMAPDLLVYEVANALFYHPDLSIDEVKEDLEALLMLDLDLIQPSGEFVSSIAEDARKYAVSVYDSSYLALAEATSSSLVTADRKLYEKAKKAGLALTLDEYDDG